MKNANRQPRSSATRRRLAMARRTLAALVLAFVAVSTALAGSVPDCCHPAKAPVAVKAKPACCANHGSTEESDARAIATQPVRQPAPPCCDAGICCSDAGNRAVPPQTSPAIAKQVDNALPVATFDLFDLAAPRLDRPRVAVAPSPPPRSALRAHLLNCTILC